MIIDFKIASRAPAPRRAHRLPGRASTLGLAAACALSASLSLVAAPAAAHADTVFWQTRELLTDFFRDSKNVGFRKLEPDAAERSRIEQRLGYRLARPSYTVYVATTGEHVDGYALIDEELGQHQPITFAVKLSATGAVLRQEVLVYREPHGDGVRDPRFRAQFVGKTSSDACRAGDDIAVISGATISSRAMSIGVKRALVLVDELVLHGADGGRSQTASISSRATPASAVAARR